MMIDQGLGHKHQSLDNWHKCLPELCHCVLNVQAAKVDYFSGCRVNPNLDANLGLNIQKSDTLFSIFILLQYFSSPPLAIEL